MGEVDADGISACLNGTYYLHMYCVHSGTYCMYNSTLLYRGGCIVQYVSDLHAHTTQPSQADYLSSKHLLDSASDTPVSCDGHDKSGYGCRAPHLFPSRCMRNEPPCTIRTSTYCYPVFPQRLHRASSPGPDPEWHACFRPCYEPVFYLLLSAFFLSFFLSFFLFCFYAFFFGFLPTSSSFALVVLTFSRPNFADETKLSQQQVSPKTA